MNDSLKGVLITATVILIFITCILNFIVLFPIGQGVSFSDISSNNSYLVINSSRNVISNNTLSSLSNSSTNAYDSWDITQGFMGTNSMKQGQTGVTTSITQVFSSITTIATQLFTANSPIVIVIGILSTLAGIVIIYYLYAFVRSGR